MDGGGVSDEGIGSESNGSDSATSNAAAMEMARAIRGGDRRAMAQAITRIESTLDADRLFGQWVLEALVGQGGDAIRVGITGPPGVGKSTFIEALGLHLVEKGKRVAVLAVDPSSPVSGGSILGDKTRMERLSLCPEAFIRPSPSSGSLGGVANRTREVMMLCEAAGYDVVLIETVGIGQSEVAVSSMVDFFLVLLLPAGGDQLQGIKKGVIELADALVVNKADGAMEDTASRTRADYAGAIDLIRASTDGWRTRAMLASSLESKGIEEVWLAILEHHELMRSSGDFEARRKDQSRAWLRKLLEEGIDQTFRRQPGMAEAIAREEEAVAAQKTTPAAAARSLLAAFRKSMGEGG
jgi:LAO/AO transport system kinase